LVLQLEHALAIKEEALGPEYPNVAISLENYAALLRKTGRAPEAAEMGARGIPDQGDGPSGHRSGDDVSTGAY
jgi:hypothetical protein